MIASEYTTLTNVGGIRAYVSVGIAGLGGWPAGSSASLTYTLHGFTLPVIPGVRIGPISNSEGALVIVTVDTTNMVAASSPYTAVIGLTYYRDATGGVAVDSDVVNLTVDISQRPPIISLTGTLAFVTAVGSTQVQTANMIVKNVGDTLSTLNWGRVISTDAGISGKISTDMASGVLAYNAQDSVTVSFDPTGVAAATYAGSITVNDTVIGGVTPVVLPISVVVAPRYTGGLKYTSVALGNETMNDHITYSDHEYWWEVWSFPAGKIMIRVYHNGTATAQLSNSIGVTGAVVAVPGLAFRGSDGYPSGGPVSISAPMGASDTVSFGPSVW